MLLISALSKLLILIYLFIYLFLALQHYRIVVSKVNDIIVMNNAEGQPHAK